MLCQSRLVMVKSADFVLTISNTDPDVGKVFLNEMGREHSDGFVLGRTERCYAFNFVLPIQNLSFESGDSSWNVHAGEAESAEVMSVTEIVRQQ